MGPAGPEGPAGPQGVPGPAGPSGGGDGARTIVDALGAEVGTIELTAGLVSRKYGDDVVLLPLAPQGFTQADITFFHTSSDCSGPRYLMNNGGLFGYIGSLIGSSVFYTRLADWAFTPLSVPVLSVEVVPVNSDPFQPGACTPQNRGKMSIGVAVGVTDPEIASFQAPFRLK
jgi:hypothetical protein